MRYSCFGLENDERSLGVCKFDLDKNKWSVYILMLWNKCIDKLCLLGVFYYLECGSF